MIDLKTGLWWNRQGTWWFLICQCWCPQSSGQGMLIWAFFFFLSVLPFFIFSCHLCALEHRLKYLEIHTTWLSFFIFHAYHWVWVQNLRTGLICVGVKVGIEYANAGFIWTWWSGFYNFWLVELFGLWLTECEGR